MYSYLVITLCLFIAAFTTWKEYQAGKRRLGLRIVASIVVAAAVAALALPLSYPGQNQLPTNDAVLLTPGFNKDSLGSFKNNTPLAFDAAAKKEYDKARLITAGQLKTITPKITRLHVFGFGLGADELSQLDSLQLIFHPTPIPTGIIVINWNGKLKSGQRLIVEGKFLNTSDKTVKLVLKAFNTGVDSAVISSKGTSKFMLADLPRGIGPSVYRLIALSGKDTIADEKLPLIIEPVKPLKILILAASPNFEDKFLKNWLTSNGFAVAVRSAISKNKISSEYVNADNVSLNTVSAPLLGKFDLVISDLSVLRSLSTTENNNLKQQVITKGLGLIVRADSIYKTSSWVQGGFQSIKPLLKNPKTVQLVIDAKKTNSKTITPDQLFLNSQEDAQSLVTDDHNRWLAGMSLAGSGKISVITLNDSYTWMLNGNKDDYAALWSLLIGKTVHNAAPTESWQITDGTPSVNEPVYLQVETGKETPGLSIDSTYLSPAQNPGLPFQWQSEWWPSTAGWHQAKLLNGAAAWFYVYNKTAWKSIQALKKTDLTQKYARNYLSKAFKTQIHQKIKIPVPKGYFYFLLLSAFTYIWVEEKLRSGGVY